MLNLIVRFEKIGRNSLSGFFEKEISWLYLRLKKKRECCRTGTRRVKSECLNRVSGFWNEEKISILCVCNVRVVSI